MPMCLLSCRKNVENNIVNEYSMPYFDDVVLSSGITKEKYGSTDLNELSYKERLELYRLALVEKVLPYVFGVEGVKGDEEFLKEKYLWISDELFSKYWDYVSPEVKRMPILSIKNINSENIGYYMVSGDRVKDVNKDELYMTLLEWYYEDTVLKGKSIKNWLSDLAEGCVDWKKKADENEHDKEFPYLDDMPDAAEEWRKDRKFKAKLRRIAKEYSK